MEEAINFGETKPQTDVASEYPYDGFIAETIETPEDTYKATIVEEKIVYDKSKELGIGSGGTIVYRGRYGYRSVAVKQLTYFKRKMEAETEISRLSKCDRHHNVIRYYGHKRIENYILLALELADGTLDDWVESQEYRKKFNKSLTKKGILQQVTSGLRYLHQNRIIHRDLKPKNILLSKESDLCAIVKISDFGISVLANEDRTSKTTTSVGGTEGWMAPEVLNHASRPAMSKDSSSKFTMTTKVDIFSLGCVFYYVLTYGKHLFGDNKVDRPYLIRRGEHFIGNDNLRNEEKLDIDINVNLLKTMISEDCTQRPDCDSILSNEIFWPNDNVLDFLIAVGNVVQDAKKSKPGKFNRQDHFHETLTLTEVGESITKSVSSKNSLVRKGSSESNEQTNAKRSENAVDLLKCKEVLEEKYKETICQKENGWYNHICPVVRSYLENRKNYRDSHKSVYQMVRVIRNLYTHFGELDPAIQLALGEIPDEFFNYWFSRFPLLLFHVKNAFQSQASNPRLYSFYKNYLLENETQKLSDETIQIEINDINDIKRKYINLMNHEIGNATTYHHDLGKAHETTMSLSLYGVNSKLQEEVIKGLERLFHKYKERNDLVSWSCNPDEPAIGIDFGTTYSRVALYSKGDMSLVQFANTKSKIFVHSLVRVNTDGTYAFGPTVKSEENKNPESTIYNLKRLISRCLDENKFEEDLKFYPFAVEKAEPLKVKINEESILPESLCGELLKYVKDKAAQGLHYPCLNKAVITVPSSFTCNQRQSILDAGKEAGLSVLGIIDDTIAAALAYRMTEPISSKEPMILIYDLGGGTFNVSVIKMCEDKIQVLSKNGDAFLGGEDFDRNMMLYCAEQFQQYSGINLVEDIDSSDVKKQQEARKNLRFLQKQCEEGKKKLMITKSTRMVIEKIAGDQDLDVEITMADFEKINNEPFSKTIELVKQTLNSANLTNNDIDEVIFVGALSSGIPKIKNMLKNILPGTSFNEKYDAERIVAYGAAAYAATLCCFKPNVEKVYFDIQDIM